MYIHVTLSTFIEGLRAMLEYLEELEEGTGMPIELDVIAICCEFTEFDSIEDFKSSYEGNFEELEDIEDHTVVIPIDGSEGFIIQDY